MLESFTQKPPFIEVASEAVKSIKEPLLLYGILESIFLIFILLVGKNVPSGLVPLVYVLAALVLFIAFSHFTLSYRRQRLEFIAKTPQQMSTASRKLQPQKDSTPDKIRFFSKSDSPEFHSYIEQLILKVRHQVFIGTGLNILQRDPITSDVFKRAAQGCCSVEIYLADPICPDVEIRLIEEELGDFKPPVGKTGLVQRLETLVDLWKKFNYCNSISINLFMHYPTFALLILDDDYFIYPYGYAILGNYSPVLQFSKDNSEDQPIIEFLDNQYRRVKENSVDARTVFAVRNTKSIDVNKLYPFALYFIPPEDSEFYRFGTKILGYDIRKHQIHLSQWQEYVGTANEFGFHLTLCDVLYFFSETQAGAAIAEIRFLLKQFKPFEISGFQIASDFPAPGNVAIRVQDPDGILVALENELVHRVY
jgi:hypothetical protein